MKNRVVTRESIEKKKSLTVAAIADSSALSLSPEVLEQSCDIVELRLDSLGWESPVIEFAKICPLPILTTARGPIEGGANSLSLAQRDEAYRTMLPYTSLLDIEMRDLNSLHEIISEARKNDILTIGSYHHFEKTPELGELEEKLSAPVDIHKFALYIQDKGDLTTLLSLLNSPSPCSVMGMGPLGAASRPLMAKAGSILNYGFVGDTPTAPGQWPAKLLKEALKI